MEADVHASVVTATNHCTCGASQTASCLAAGVRWLSAEPVKQLAFSRLQFEVHGLFCGGMLSCQFVMVAQHCCMRGPPVAASCHVGVCTMGSPTLKQRGESPLQIRDCVFGQVKSLGIGFWGRKAVLKCSFKVNLNGSEPLATTCQCVGRSQRSSSWHNGCKNQHRELCKMTKNHLTQCGKQT